MNFNYDSSSDDEIESKSPVKSNNSTINNKDDENKKGEDKDDINNKRLKKRIELLS